MHTSILCHSVTFCLHWFWFLQKIMLNITEQWFLIVHWWVNTMCTLDEQLLCQQNISQNLHRNTHWKKVLQKQPNRGKWRQVFHLKCTLLLWCYLCFCGFFFSAILLWWDDKVDHNLFVNGNVSCYTIKDQLLVSKVTLTNSKKKVPICAPCQMEIGGVSVRQPNTKEERKIRFMTCKTSTA